MTRGCLLVEAVQRRVGVAYSLVFGTYEIDGIY